MVQIKGVTINGEKFVVDNTVAVTVSGRAIAVEDRPADTRWGR